MHPKIAQRNIEVTAKLLMADILESTSKFAAFLASVHAGVEQFDTHIVLRHKYSFFTFSTERVDTGFVLHVATRYWWEESEATQAPYVTIATRLPTADEMDATTEREASVYLEALFDYTARWSIETNADQLVFIAGMLRFLASSTVYLEGPDVRDGNFTLTVLDKASDIVLTLSYNHIQARQYWLDLDNAGAVGIDDSADPQTTDPQT